MFRVRVNVSRKGYPSKQYARELNSIPALYEEKALTIYDFGAYCSNAHAWRAARLKPNAKKLGKGNYEAAQIIALDFDGLDDLESLIHRFADFGICPNFIYPSMSQDPETWDEAKALLVKMAEKSPFASDADIIYIGPERKGPKIENTDTDFPTFIDEDGTQHIDLSSIATFYEDYELKRHYKDGYNFRAVFVLEEECSLTKYEQVVIDLLELFPDADKATKDHSRLWFGGDLDAVYLSQEPVKLADLGRCTALKLYNEGKKPSKAKLIKRGFNQEYQAKSQPLRDVKVLIPASYTDFYEMLYKHCYQFRCFVDADWEHFDNNVRVSLFTNFTEVKWADNNRSLLKDLAGIWEDHEDVWEANTTTFTPSRIEEIFNRPATEAYKICFYGGENCTIAEFLERTTAAPRIIKHDFRQVEEVDKELPQAIRKVMTSGQNYYFTAQTGSGKTEAYLNEIDTFSKRTLLAVPTYNLVREVAQRAKAKGMKNVYPLPEAEWTKEDLALMSIGMPAITVSPERNDWRQEVKEGTKSGLFICPHQQLSTLDTFRGFDSIIVDENIEEVLCPIYNLDIDSVAAMGATFPYLKDALDEWAATAHSLEAGEKAPTLAGIIKAIRQDLEFKDLEERMQVVSSVPQNFLRLDDIEGFKSSDGQSVYYISPSQLMNRATAHGIPLKLFSATPRPTFIDIYFPNWNYSQMNIEKAKNQGQVIQFIGNTGARGINNNKVKELAKTARKQLTKLGVDPASAPVISFKGTEKIWEKQGFKVARNPKGEQVHLMNCSGMDQWKGQDLIIAGKTCLPNTYMQDRYQDYCRIHHIKDDAPAERQTISRTIGGIKTNVFGWNKPVLQAFEDEWLSFTLEQALGRARVVRTNATVYLFTNYIVDSANVIYG